MEIAFPDIHAGDYFEFGEGETYARILVLTPDTCIVKDGVGVGEIISINEWYFITQGGSTNEKIRRCGYHCRDDPPSPRPRGILRTATLRMPYVMDNGTLYPIVRYNRTVNRRTYSYDDTEDTLHCDDGKPIQRSGTPAAPPPSASAQLERGESTDNACCRIT